MKLEPGLEAFYVIHQENRSHQVYSTAPITHTGPEKLRKSNHTASRRPFSEMSTWNMLVTAKRDNVYTFISTH